MRKVYHVTGSHGDPYEITLTDEGGELHAHCTCPAGTFGSLCKHILKVISDDPEAYQALQQYKISDYYDQYLTKTAEAEKLKREAASYKKGLARKLLQ